MTDIAQQQIFIAAAAVADYRPATAADTKIKKTSDSLELTMVKNPDILAGVAALNNAPFTVGFAAETENLVDYARDKLRNKQLDMIAANRVAVADSGFNSEFNELIVLWDDEQQLIAHARKRSVARQLVQMIATRYHAQQASGRHTA